MHRNNVHTVFYGMEKIYLHV